MRVRSDKQPVSFWRLLSNLKINAKMCMSLQFCLEGMMEGEGTGCLEHYDTTLGLRLFARNWVFNLSIVVIFSICVRIFTLGMVFILVIGVLKC